MPVALGEQEPAERHALARRTQARPARSIAVTSCHGQPLSAASARRHRHLRRFRPSASRRRHRPRLRHWHLPSRGHRATTESLRFEAQVRDRAARCNSFATADFGAFEAVPCVSDRLDFARSIRVLGTRRGRQGRHGAGRAGMTEQRDELRLRGAARLRARRTVRPGQRAAAAAADADVRPHLRDRRDRRRARQGPDPRRARRQAGPLVLRLPLQGRSGDAGLPRPRRALADARLLPRLARRAGHGPRARSSARSSSPAGAADREARRLRRRPQARHALEAGARHRRRLAQGRRRDHLPGEATCKVGLFQDAGRSRAGG